MPDNLADESVGGPATALAEPPQPPTTPPTGIASGEAPRPRKRPTGLVAVILVGMLALVLLVVVASIVLTARSGTAPTSVSAKAEFESAMKKAGVQAAFPQQPVGLSSVKATGSHPFAAVFTADEIAALLNTFPYESDAAGMRIEIRDARIEIPEAGVASLSAKVTANGSTYSGSVTMPATFWGGRIDSPGATDLTVEGVPGSTGQTAQVGDALVAYFNAYLAASPGLEITSAAITTQGLDVAGTAPDSLAYP